MSQQRVERLEALLTRVQANRRATRTIAGMPSPAPMMRSAPVAAPAAGADAKPSRGAAPAMAGAGRPAPMTVDKPTAMEPAAARGASPPSPPAAPRSRAEAVAARAPEPAKSETPAARARESSPPAGRARSVPPPQPVLAAAHAQEPAAPDEEFEPNVIEPEPMREPARPIAQVVSRHAPQADATFGAMLKRSLSLRPN